MIANANMNRNMIAIMNRNTNAIIKCLYLLVHFEQSQEWRGMQSQKLPSIVLDVFW